MEDGKRNIQDISGALPYVDNLPHNGNVIGSVWSKDVYARYHLLRDFNAMCILDWTGYETISCTHKEICDKFAAIHQELYTWFDISFYKFGQTSTPDQTQVFSNNLSSSDNIMPQVSSRKDRYIPFEAWRYYLHTSRPEVSDTSFECKVLQTKLSGDLVIILVNFINRVLSFIAKPENAGYGSVIPDAPGAESHLPTKSLAAKVGELVNEYVEAMGKVNLKQGLIAAMHIAGEGNLYVEEHQFWKLYREDKPCCAVVIRSAAGLVLLAAQLLEPFMPSFSHEVFKQLNFPPRFALSSLPQAPWKILPPRHRIGTPQPWFKYLEKFAGGLADRLARDGAQTRAPANLLDQRLESSRSLMSGEASGGGGGGGGGGEGESDGAGMPFLQSRKSDRAHADNKEKNLKKQWDVEGSSQASADPFDQRLESYSSLLSPGSQSVGAGMPFLLTRKKRRQKRAARLASDRAHAQNLNNQWERLRLISLIILTQNSYGATKKPPVEREIDLLN